MSLHLGMQIAIASRAIRRPPPLLSITTRTTTLLKPTIMSSSSPNKRLKSTNSDGVEFWVSSSANKNDKGTPQPQSERPNDEKDSQMSSEMAKRIEINKALAKAKLAQKLCLERVVQAQENGNPLPKLDQLLVEKSWFDVLSEELEKPYMQELSEFLTKEANGNVPIYPPKHLIFNALNICPFEKVKVVILGQDPYHGPGQAMGLCFSVPKGIKIPSSLVNIFKEIKEDTGVSLPLHGNLERWAIQGVLLLNTVLTVREHQANSHANKGWEVFTDAIIRYLSLKKKGLVFILWGNSAQQKIRIIDSSRHHILKSAHPSGLSAHRGFFKCRHFSMTNKILEKSGATPIDWQN